MGKFTGEVIYDEPKARTKPVVNPALVNALVPPVSTPVAPMSVTPNMPLSPQDQRAFNLSQQNRLAAEELKKQEEKRKEANPLASMTESERTAGFLLQRLDFAEKQLKDTLQKNPDATKPEYLPSLVENFSETGANLIRSTPRQQIETAQYEILDSA